MRLGTTEEDWCFADGDGSERRIGDRSERRRLALRGWRQIGAEMDTCDAEAATNRRDADAVVEWLETDRSCLRGAPRRCCGGRVGDRSELSARREAR